MWVNNKSKSKLNISDFLYEEPVQNDVLIYERYHYYDTRSQPALVLYPDKEFAGTSVDSFRYKVVRRNNDSVLLNIPKQTMKSIKNNSRYYIVLGYNGETRYCIAPHTNRIFFLRTIRIDSIMFHEEPYDNESRALI